MDRVIKFAFLTFFMAVMIESPRQMRLFLAAFLFSTFYVTQEAVRGLISGGLVWQNQGVMRLHGAVPIYAHPNSLAGVAMGCIPFVAFLFPHTRRWWLKLALLAPAGDIDDMHYLFRFANRVCRLLRFRGLVVVPVCQQVQVSTARSCCRCGQSLGDSRTVHRAIQEHRRTGGGGTFEGGAPARSWTTPLRSFSSIRWVSEWLRFLRSGRRSSGASRTRTISIWRWRRISASRD